MLVIPTLSNGGAERVVSVLAKGLADANYCVEILRFYKTNEDYFVDSKVEIITLCENKDEYEKMNKITHFRKMHKIFKKSNPDHIIPFLRHVNIQTVLSSGKWFKKIIYTIRVFPTLDKSLLAKFHDFLINYTNKTIVQNEEQKECYKKSAYSRIFVLNNPVNEKFLNAKREVDGGSYNIVSAGRLSKQKNFSMLIAAFSKFSKDKKNVYLSIYGTGDECENLQKLIDELNMQSKIKLMGRSDDLASVYRNSNLYVLSSNYEGMPNALLEAMASELPCISTDCKSGPKEMIETGVNGLLVPTGDETALLEAMNFMYFNQEKAETMAQVARKTVIENYKVEKIINELLGILKS